MAMTQEAPKTDTPEEPGKVKKSNRRPRIERPEALAGSGVPGATRATHDAPSTPEQDLKPPPLQEGRRPTIEDCFSDASDPPPTPPLRYNVIHHGPPPKSAFRILPREEGKPPILVTKVLIPYGEAGQGEAFSYPLPKTLIQRVTTECPNLAIKRFEARIAVDAAGNPKVVEAPFDPLVNKTGERNRLSFLRMLQIAETKAIVAFKVPGGGWGHKDGGPNFEQPKLAQTQAELVTESYAAEFIDSIAYPALQKYRVKV
jgi:hypothetical protein